MKKKFLFLSKRDSVGGASEWFFNLALTLVKYQYNVVFVVEHKTKNQAFIIEIPYKKRKKSYLKRLINLIKRVVGIKSIIRDFNTNPEYAFFSGENELDTYVTAEEIYSKIPFIPDIIISGLVYEFVNSSVLLKLKSLTYASVFQVAFDANIFTGGCHVTWGCEGYKTDCSNCPGILNKIDFYSYTVKNLYQKKKNISEGNFGILLTGGWLIDKANQSLLYKHSEKIDIGNCIDTDLFCDKNRDIAKRIFNFPSNRKVILFGADNVLDKRKGFSCFIQSLEILWELLTDEERENLIVLIIGNNININLNLHIKFEKLYLGYINDSRLLSLVYQASDIFVCPSLEDAGPVMVAEALACGTPVVGFKMGLLYDDRIVKNHINGYRANLEDVKSLAEGLQYILYLSRKDFNIMSKCARKSAEDFLSEKNFVDIMSSL